METGWPRENAITQLEQRADGLFIYAATVCRFIGEQDGDPEERLDFVVRDQMEDESPTGHLDIMYTTLLQ
jgi:hypothetical protein